MEYLVGVSFGVVSLARSGVLNGRRATTNKSGWKWITTGHGENVTWVPQARWVEDGNIWTASGMASGMLDIRSSCSIESAHNFKVSTPLMPSSGDFMVRKL